MLKRNEEAEKQRKERRERSGEKGGGVKKVF